MRVISVINYKGGVGKTTLTANLGAEIANRGKRILLIDLDPQCSLTHSFYTAADYQLKVRPNQTIKHWFDSFADGVPRSSLAEFVVTPPDTNRMIRIGRGRLDMLASDVLLFKLDLDIAKLSSNGDIDLELFKRRRALLDALSERTFPRYDYVLIDCPPGFGLLTQSALAASNDIIMPAKADYLSTVGLDTLYNAIHDFIADYNAQVLRFGGKHAGGAYDLGSYTVVFTMVEFMNQVPAAAHRFYMDQVAKVLRIPCFKSVMRQNVTLYGRRAHIVPAVLHPKGNEQIHTELLELVDEFMKLFETSRGGLAAA